MKNLFRSVAASNHHKDGFHQIENLYFCKFNPFQEEYITKNIESINEQVPKFLSGTTVSLTDIVHVFASRDTAKEFFYICSHLFDKFTGKRIFKYEHIDANHYLTCIGDINNSANITRKIIIKK